jgi:hypothetical protein
MSYPSNLAAAKMVSKWAGEAVFLKKKGKIIHPITVKDILD